LAGYHYGLDRMPEYVRVIGWQIISEIEIGIGTGNLCLVGEGMDEMCNIYVIPGRSRCIS
jgi:hypothetical protein